MPFLSIAGFIYMHGYMHTNAEHLEPVGFPVVNGIHPVKGLTWTYMGMV